LSLLPHDVFICHASEDKEAVARPLARALQVRGLSVWLDEVEIRLGDSLRQKIDEGLGTSTFGVVILSPSFFTKRWAQWELDGLADREMSSGTKVVLPVWYQVEHDEVSAHSPLLASKRAARWSDGVERVADEVAEILRIPVAAAPTIERVPRSPEEEAALLRARSAGWEYLLFAAVLRREMDALEPKYRDYELGYARPTYGPLLDVSETSKFLAGAFQHVRAVLANFNRIMDPKAQERAFGPLGTPGDAERIRHLAERVIAIYNDLLDWAARLRSAAVDHRFQRVVELVSASIEGPLRQFREFVDEVVAEIDRLPALLREETTEPRRIVLTLTLSMDEEVEKELSYELERLGEGPF
jgi:TIR domain